MLIGPFVSNSRSFILALIKKGNLYGKSPFHMRKSHLSTKRVNEMLFLTKQTPSHHFTLTTFATKERILKLFTKRKVNNFYWTFFHRPPTSGKGQKKSRWLLDVVVAKVSITFPFSRRKKCNDIHAKLSDTIDCFQEGKKFSAREYALSSKKG